MTDVLEDLTARLSTFDLDCDEGFSALFRGLTRGSTRAKHRRRRLLTVVTAVTAGLVGVAGVAVATGGAHTGIFGLPGFTENDTSEYLSLNATDFRDTALQYTSGFDYAPGYSAQMYLGLLDPRHMDAQTAPELRGRGYVMQVTGVRGARLGLLLVGAHVHVRSRGARPHEATRRLRARTPDQPAFLQPESGGAGGARRPRAAQAVRPDQLPRTAVVAGSVTDDSRFEEVYVATRDDLLRYFLRRVQEPADAADLLADVFVVAWRHREQPHDDPRLWLFGVARKVLAAHRRGKRTQTALADRLREQVVEQYEPSLDDLHVCELLGHLSGSDRELIELVIYDQLTPAEIAALLGKSPGTIRVRIHRARQRLQAVLASQTTTAETVTAHTAVQGTGSG
jgi:RNA polymerase sigma factor (sigma-70 family)